MKRLPFATKVLIALGVLVVVAVALYFVHPIAPLLLLVSVLIQLPFIISITKTNFTAGYRDRAMKRIEQYREDGDAAAWLAGEEKEAAAVGFRYWSRGGRALCALNQAAALVALGRRDEAAEVLNALDWKRLNREEKQRYDELVLDLGNAARFDDMPAEPAPSPPGNAP